MDHLAEINDGAVHDAVDLFEARIELLVLDLLDTDDTIAIDQITRARERAADRIINLARDCPAASEDARAVRIAASMLTKPTSGCSIRSNIGEPLRSVNWCAGPIK